jgi:hypothetical protein
MNNNSSIYFNPSIIEHLSMHMLELFHKEDISFCTLYLVLKKKQQQQQQEDKVK